jgi:uncharacterized protein (DUF433 family)
MQMTLRGVIHGKMIELTHEPGLPEGMAVEVTLETTPAPRPAPPWWLEHLDVDPTVKLGKFVVKGTRLLADALVEEMETGRSDQELLHMHPELTLKGVAAAREYAKLPVEMRRCFGAWAEDAEELDKYLEWTRQQRKVGRRRIED